MQTHLSLLARSGRFLLTQIEIVGFPAFVGSRCRAGGRRGWFPSRWSSWAKPINLGTRNPTSPSTASMWPMWVGLSGVKMSVLSCSGNCIAGMTGKEVTFSRVWWYSVLCKVTLRFPGFVLGHAGRDGVWENWESDGCEFRFGWRDWSSRMQKMVC